MARSPAEILADARGRKLGALATTGIGALWLAAIESGIETLQAFFQIPIQLFNSFAEAVGALVASFVLEPLGIIQAGAQISAAELRQFGILAFIAGLVLVLLGYWIINTYLNEEETSNFLPGLPFDVPFVGVEEEADAED